MQTLAEASRLVHLAHGVLHQELELLVPDGSPVPTGMAGGILPAAAHGL